MPHHSVSGGSRHLRLDPVLGEPLVDAQLLHILSPEELIDQAAAENFAEFLTEVVVGGGLDGLDHETEYTWLSGSRMARMADRDLSDMVVQELQARGLIRRIVEAPDGDQAGRYTDGSAVLIHPAVRRVILAFWAQALRGPGERLGYSLQPITSRADIVDSMTSMLRMQAVHTAGDVLSLDLQEVSFNLSRVPLEDVLQFRQEHGPEHRDYMRSLRRSVSALEGLEGNARRRALEDRQEELRDAADRLKRTTRQHLIKKAPSFALSLVGSIGHAVSGNLPGAASSGGGALGQIIPPASTAGAYSYLFRLHGWFPN